MAYTASVYRVLIASPSDVELERRLILEVVYYWNAVHSAELSLVLLPVMWETHATPELGDRPQAIINKQLVQACDLLVGVFWTRIGTQTGEADSGTVEEIQQFIDAGKPILLYFSSKPVIPDSVDQRQYQKLRAFKKRISQAGLVDSFGSDAQLRIKVYTHLVTTIRKLHGVSPANADTAGRHVQEMQARVADERRRMRASALEKLRMEYIFSHDGISPQIMAGTALPPKEWLDRRIQELGWQDLFKE